MLAQGKGPSLKITPARQTLKKSSILRLLMQSQIYINKLTEIAFRCDQERSGELRAVDTGCQLPAYTGQPMCKQFL